MVRNKIDGEFLELMLQNGYRNIMLNQAEIDALNVFPVPDGDTGLNMTMTMSGGVENHESSKNVGEMMASFAHGTLFSARGNSGVILSQFINGFAKGSKDMDTMSVSDFAKAMESGVKQAYKSVVRPVEGTMLTVMREATEFLSNNKDSFASFEDCFMSLMPVIRRSLDNTPNLLPVLEEAGVIDSGGAGFLTIVEGMKLALEGEILSDDSKASSSLKPSSKISLLPDNGTLEYGYCTEFILQLIYSDHRADSFNLDEMIATLETFGDSIVAIREDNVVKVHVHTFTPEKVLAYARGFGEFLTLKIENMALQHNESIKENKKKKKHQKYAIATVASGRGIQEYLTGIGADVIISGGQTDNPSTEDFINAFDTLDADYIVVLPNNSNVIMAAKQAAKIYDKADVRVIETRSVAEGYSALSMMNNSVDTVEELIEGMSFGIPNVTTGYITTATRDSSMGGVAVKQGDYIGLDRETIRSSEKSKTDAVMGLLKNLPGIDEKEVLTGFFGNGVAEEEAEALKELIEESFPMLECAFIEGDQPVYDYIFALE
ncbi:MAG: DAK2 domain-containing protein [Oscillospiraceae bacterium]|nr:DAK2 domain-containing protein [Oscillospiraceae bacterium]